jgi:hypothetical protein
MEGCKRPRDAPHGQPLLNLPILQDIIVIVIRKEIVGPHTAEGKNGDHHKNDADGGNQPRWVRFAIIACTIDGCSIIISISSTINDSLFGKRFWRALATGFALSLSSGHDGQPRMILPNRSLIGAQPAMV